MSNFSKFVAGAVVAMGLAFTGMNSAQAGGYGYGYNAYVPHCHYEWVTTWEFRTIKDVIYVTDYDCYHNPIQVQKVVFKTIKVPVKKYVKVCH